MDSFVRELYCKIFLQTNLDFAALFGMLNDRVGGKPHGRRISTTQMTIDLALNDDHDNAFPQNETRWKYYLDVSPLPRVNASDYKAAIRHLLLSLRSDGFPAVAACEFEDELL